MTTPTGSRTAPYPSFEPPPPTLAAPGEPRPRPSVRERWFGAVRPLSGRGIGAMVILLIVFLIVFADPIVSTIRLLREGSFSSGPPPEITAGLLVFGLLLNTVVLVVIPLAYLRLILPGRGAQVLDQLRLRWTNRSPLHILLGAGVTLAVMFAAGGLLSLLIEQGVLEQPETSTILTDLQTQLNWFLVFAIPIVAAATEEIFFRGILQPRLGLWATSALFGIVHIVYGTVLQLVAPFVLGLLFGFLFLRTRSLWAPIAGHFTFNFVELALLLLEREGPSVGFL